MRGETNRCLAQAKAQLGLYTDALSPLQRAAVLHATHLLLRQCYRALLGEILDEYHRTERPYNAAEAASLLQASGIISPELSLLQQHEDAESAIAALLADWQDQRPAASSPHDSMLINVMQVDESKVVLDLAWYQAACETLHALLLSVREMGQQW